MSDEKKSFQFPKLECGDAIRVSFDKAFSKPMLGRVNIAKASSINCVVNEPNGRQVIYNDCRHRDDPYLLEHPNFIGQPGHAIFDLTAEYAERKWLKETVPNLVALVEQQAHVLSEQSEEIRILKTSRSSVGEPPRGPGRPRKLETIGEE